MEKIVITPVGSRLHRHLRIAVAVLSEICSVLMIVLWVCSYKSHTDFSVRHLGTQQRLYAATAQAGAIHLCVAHQTPPAASGRPGGWDVILPTGRALGFGTHINPLMKALRIPLWFLTLLSLLCAAAVAFDKLPQRFTLRTLLIALTVAAIALGLIAWAVKLIA